MPSFEATARRSLIALIAWAILAAVWNFAGVWLVANGQRALGPTATIAGGLVLIVIIAALLVVVKRWPLVYLLLAIGCGLLAGITVVGAFTNDPALWPSEFWRYAGAAVNSIGVAAAVAAVVAYARRKT